MPQITISVKVSFPENSRIGVLLVSNAELNFMAGHTLLVANKKSQEKNASLPMSEWDTLIFGGIHIENSAIRGGGWEPLNLSGYFSDSKKDRILKAHIEITFKARES